MNTKFLALISAIGLATLCVVQAQSPRSAGSPPPSGRMTEEAINAQAPGGGHGQVWVNTETGVYHREGSPFYGTTRKGKYMTEQDATQAGYKRAPKGS